jgi:hypothetical protein
MADELPLDETKQALKEALKEWLDEQFAAFGRWTFYSLLSIVFGGVVYIVVTYKMAH